MVGKGHKGSKIRGEDEMSGNLTGVASPFFFEMQLPISAVNFQRISIMKLVERCGQGNNNLVSVGIWINEPMNRFRMRMSQNYLRF